MIFQKFEHRSRLGGDKHVLGELWRRRLKGTEVKNQPHQIHYCLVLFLFPLIFLSLQLNGQTSKLKEVRKEARILYSLGLPDVDDQVQNSQFDEHMARFSSAVHALKDDGVPLKVRKPYEELTITWYDLSRAKTRGRLAITKHGVCKAECNKNRIVARLKSPDLSYPPNDGKCDALCDEEYERQHKIAMDEYSKTYESLVSRYVKLKLIETELPSPKAK